MAARFSDNPRKRLDEELALLVGVLDKWRWTWTTTMQDS